MEWHFGIGIAAGVAIGAFPGYLIADRAVERIAILGRAAIVRVCAVSAALLALVPAFFLAVVLGGNFGGAWAASLLGQSVVPIGIGLGIGVVLAICSCGAAVIGAVLGVVVSRALGKPNAA